MIEDTLDNALMAAHLGEVTGGGSSGRGLNIDVEIEDENRFNEALALIRQVLHGLKAPSSTYIKRYAPEEIVYQVYE